MKNKRKLLNHLNYLKNAEVPEENSTWNNLTSYLIGSADNKDVRWNSVQLADDTQHTWLHSRQF